MYRRANSFRVGLWPLGIDGEKTFKPAHAVGGQRLLLLLIDVRNDFRQLFITKLTLYAADDTPHPTGCGHPQRRIAHRGQWLIQIQC